MLIIKRNQLAIDARRQASLARAKTEAKVALARHVEGLLERFTVEYPRQETLAWGSKLAAARGVMAGGSNLILQVEADTLGIPVATLAAKVVEKGSLYEQIVAVASALRGASHAQIEAATSEDAIETVLATAKQTASATIGGAV